MKHLLTAKPWFSGCLCLLLCLLTNTQADEAKPEKMQLYLGIANKRIPYTYIDKQQQASGILVASVTHLCEQINAHCNFVAEDFEQLLEDVRTFKLHGMIVIDDFISPEIDGLKLTSPLCMLTPALIQKQVENPRLAPEDFKSTTIGVQEGSLLHLYLLDAYSSSARLKPYPILESAVFDLVSGRIDALLADDAFFRERVAKTILGKANSNVSLIAPKLDGVDLPATSMTLAVRAHDKELLAALEQAIQASGKTLSCASLLKTDDTAKAKPND